MRTRRGVFLACGASLLAAFAHAQSPSPSAWPFASPAAHAATTGSTAWPFASASVTPAGAAAADDQPPPYDIPLVEKPWDQIADHNVGPDGDLALAIKPDRWRHAETDDFYIHYRRVTEAHKVVREVEYDLWFVARSLGATPAQYHRHKSHVFVFEDENEWRNFLQQTNAPAWFGSFAFHDELFLSVRNIERGGAFDSSTLAHETTHAVVSRIYPFEHWPVWLNEGFAEYMAGASVSMRTHQPLKNYQHALTGADMKLDALFATKVYPPEREDVDKLYQSSEKFVRFLMTTLPKERFRMFVTAVLESGDPKASILKVYGDKFPNFDAFEKKYAAFSN